MDPLLDAHRQTLFEWQAMCAAQPGVHAHQLAALARESALAETAADLAAYQRASGSAFELTRSAWLDRVAGRLRVAVAVDDDFGAQAAWVEYRTLVQACGHADWAGRLADAALNAAPWHTRAALAGSQLANCVQNLLMWQTADPPMGDHLGDARSAWRLLCEADPEGARAAIDAPDRLPRVARRWPWCGDASTMVSGWLAALPAPAQHDQVACDADPLALLADGQARWQRDLLTTTPSTDLPWDATAAGTEPVLAAYLALASPGPQVPASIRAMAPVAARMLAVAAGADSGMEVQRRWIAARLPAALAAAVVLGRADELAARQRLHPEPLLAAHAAGLARAMAGARSETEVALLSIHADACLAIEVDVQSMLMTAALTPLRAAAMAGACGEAAAAGLQRAVVVAHGLMGLAPRALLRNPAVLGFVHGHLRANLADPGSTQGAWFGEAGLEALPAMRGWHGMALASQEPWTRDLRSVPEALARLLDTLGAPEPAAKARCFRLWGDTQTEHGWDRLLAAPVRPPVPYCTAATVGSAASL